MDKKVSIITPCFNGEQFVGRYLDSILNQTYKNIELIFVNDGSNDKTEEIVKSYINKFNRVGMNLIYLYQKNLGQAAAINQGLKIFTGEYLTWPDSDDILAYDSIEKKVNFLKKNSQYGLVRTDAKLVNEENLEQIIGYFSEGNTNKYKEKLFMDLITENKVWFAPGCYMLRSSAFLDMNSDRRIYEGKGGQNWQMLLPIMYRYKCGYIDEPLYTYVIRSSSHSHSSISLESQLKKCDEHEDILINTFNYINMNDEEQKEYITIVREKYIRKRFNLACEWNNKVLAEKYYYILKDKCICSFDDKIMYLSSRNIIFNVIYKVIRKIGLVFIK